MHVVRNNNIEIAKVFIREIMYSTEKQGSHA